MSAGRLRLDVRPTLTSPTLLLAVEGWNDAGEAASSAARFLSNALDTVPLGEIDCEPYYDFTVRRPEVRLDDRGVRHVDWPDFELRYGSIEGRCDVVVGLGAEPHLRWRSFCEQVQILVEQLSLKRVILLGAFMADVLYSRPVRVGGFATDLTTLERHGIEPSSYEGPTGILGVLGDALGRCGCDVVSLWAGLPHYISVTPNPRGALALVQKATEILDFPADPTRLEKDAAAFEQQISEMVAADPSLAQYVKELKRREFAQ